MTVRKLWLAALLIVSVLLAACSGPKAIHDGVLRDTIFAIEHHANGAVSVWMTHDDVGVYCTLDGDMAARLDGLFRGESPEVFLTYGSVNVGTGEATNVLNWSQGCAYESDENTTVYRIIAVESASAEQEQ
jgi:ABC-type amino acid transport substrate-binding protein